MYRLTNEGQLPAEDVTVTSHPTLWIDQAGTAGDLRPGEALAFMAAPDLGTQDMTITVTWQDATADARQTWRYPLPGKGGR
jgi:hypothetical protein